MNRHQNRHDLHAFPRMSAAPKDGMTPGERSGELADRPVLVLGPSRETLLLQLREVWRYRELLLFLIWRDVKIRYKQTVLGVGWAIIQPLFTTVVFAVLFGRLAGVRADGVPYPLFALAGILPWSFFSNAVTNSSNSLVASAHLLSKVYFPRMLIPTAAVCGCLLDLSISYVLLALLMWHYAVFPAATLLLMPLLLFLLVALALGAGLLMAALNVKYRDVRHALPFAIQLWMFVTPIIYPTTLVPESWRWTLLFNPLTGLIVNFRAAAIQPDAIAWDALTWSGVISLAALLLGTRVFVKMEREFADVI
jgi:lipopolysaccharide transport system permease protein